MTKKKAKKFPQLLHITIEEPGSDQWYNARTDGVASLDVHGTSVAVYKLVSVGVANITREYVEIKTVK